MRFERNKYLHSKEHVLADDLSSFMHEPKRFASYLGIAKHYHESDLRRLARYVCEKKDLPIEARGKYFFASLRGLTKLTGAHLARKRRGKAKNRRKKHAGNTTKNRKRTE